MPLDSSIFSRSDAQLPERLANILDPSNIQERKMKLSDLANERKTKDLQLQNLQRETTRAPIMDARNDAAYNQTQSQSKQAQIMQHVSKANQMILASGATDDAIKQGAQYLVQNGIPQEMAMKGFEPMMGMDIPTRQQLLAKGMMSPEKLAERTVPEQPKPTFSENSGGYVTPPSMANPQGGFTPVPGLSPKVNQDAANRLAFDREKFEYDKKNPKQAGEGWKYDASSDQWVRPPTAENPEGERSGNVGKQQAGQAMNYLISEFVGTKEKPGVIYTASTGGPVGVYGKVGRVTNTQKARRFDNLKEQMSTQLRTLFRIPGEGALSDREQAQYGLQLPDVNNEPSVNEDIIKDIAKVIEIRTGSNNTKTPPADQGWSDL